jgi:hypothetical protein
LQKKHKKALYTDATGALPAISFHGHIFFFVAYNYYNTYIFTEPIANVADAMMVDVFDVVFTELT